MNDLYKVTIGLGNRSGNTSHVIMQESKSKIQKQSAKGGWCENPRIQLKQYPDIDLGGLGVILRNRRNKNTLNELLKLDDIDCAAINKKNEALMNNIIEEEQMLQVFQRENDSEKDLEKFIKETGSDHATARKYREKYKQNAVQVYKEHDKKVKRFMEINKCSRDNALTFLENNNYDMGLF